MTLLVLIHLLIAGMVSTRQCLFVWLVVLMFHLQLVCVILHLFQPYVLNVSRK